MAVFRNVKLIMAHVMLLNVNVCKIIADKTYFQQFVNDLSNSSIKKIIMASLPFQLNFRSLSEAFKKALYKKVLNNLPISYYNNTEHVQEKHFDFISNAISLLLRSYTHVLHSFTYKYILRFV